MNSSLLILTLSVLCLPLCQPRAVTSNKDLTDYIGLGDLTLYPEDEDYKHKMFNSAGRKSSDKAFHPYGLDTLGQGNIF